MKRPWVLGISCSHNGAVALLLGNEVVCAIQEERLTRVKNDRVSMAQGSKAARYVLDAHGLEWGDLDSIVYCAQPAGLRDAYLQDPAVRRVSDKITTIPHHLGHAIAAYACSGFKDSAVLVVDGSGSLLDECDPGEQAAAGNYAPDRGLTEWASIYEFRGSEWECLSKHTCIDPFCPREPAMGVFQSLGGMYVAAAQVIFDRDPLGAAGSVMGLAAYGRRKWSTDDFFVVKDDRFIWKLNMPNLFKTHHCWPRNATIYADLAASTQGALEDGIKALVDELLLKTSSRNLCFTGGVSLNTIVNDRLCKHPQFEDVFILPAANDAGTAIGAAYYGLWKLQDHEPRRLVSDSLGRSYREEEINTAIRELGFTRIDVDIEDVVAALEQGAPIGWFCGGSEFGPRSLGQRSILYDPRRRDSLVRINEIKSREGFRPFAPAVLASHAADWFELDEASPFMLRSMPVARGKTGEVPGIVHIDGTSRPQTVDERNGLFFKLLSAWHDATETPLLLNTSFNGPGEPIVETPEEALTCAKALGIRCVYFAVGNKTIKALSHG